MNDDYLRPAQLKKQYQLSHSTLFDWENKGLLNPIRTPGGHRRYSKDEIVSVMGKTPIMTHDDKTIQDQIDDFVSQLEAIAKRLEDLESDFSEFIEIAERRINK